MRRKLGDVGVWWWKVEQVSDGTDDATKRVVVESGGGISELTRVYGGGEVGSLHMACAKRQIHTASFMIILASWPKHVRHQHDGAS